ncbi:hypothetical protein UFOVP1004_24 [uncultured Caudovirales phage]|uniref:Uncharacterized protein n=1 Tax=uncultured Caudovirales phage TaxID=2100421 RepID=A0A6J5Q0L4_9CAUD|nr:hypothetical protein UFOVP1004_24 [uncultured Caudovirales phage]
MTLSEINNKCKTAEPGQQFGGLNHICLDGDVYELVWRVDMWHVYSKLGGVIPLFAPTLTVVVADWDPGVFKGLIQSGPVTVFAGKPPKPVKIPDGAKVYQIGDPRRGVVPVSQ